MKTLFQHDFDGCASVPPEKRSPISRVAIIALLISASAFAIVHQAGAAGTSVVTSTSISIFDTGSLTRAISVANTSSPPYLIRFALTGAPPFVLYYVGADAPTISGTGIVLDARTQSGYSNAPVVSLCDPGRGLRITGASNSIYGLSITEADPGPGLLLDHSRATRVAACHIISNNGYGVFITNAHGDVLGGISTNEVNVISANALTGVELLNSTNVTVQNCLVGVTPDGLAASGNGIHGIHVSAGAAASILTNVISANPRWGVLVDGGASNAGIHGCRIGLDRKGLVFAGGLNGSGGIRVDAGRNLKIGDATRTNWISGNANGPGISLSSTNTYLNEIGANVIGLNVSNMSASNSRGIEVLNSPGNLIGSLGGIAVVAGNYQEGIYIQGGSARSNVIGSVIVGMDRNGNARGNGSHGLLIDQAPANRVDGGTLQAYFCSSSLGSGIRIQGASAVSNRIRNAIVGLGLDIASDRGNGYAGISIQDAPGTWVGEPGPPDVNCIAGNGGDGIEVLGASASHTVIAGNLIGLAGSGTSSVANGNNGIRVQDAPGVLIGLTGGTYNVISGNANAGISIYGATASNCIIIGNRIGLSLSADTRIPNGASIRAPGIVISGAPGARIGGGAAAERNMIAGNNGEGIVVEGAGSRGARILSNLIGFNGTAALSNTSHGIWLRNGATGVVIGKTNMMDETLYISGNGGHGVMVSGPTTRSNTIAGAYIGAGMSGLTAIQNGMSGVFISSNAPFTSIGSLNPAIATVLSGNRRYGLHVLTASVVTVVNTFIGPGADRLTAVTNQLGGILLDTATSCQIGTNRAGNTIGANGGIGIELIRGSDSNHLAGNWIGFGGVWNSSLANASHGIRIAGSSANVIGLPGAAPIDIGLPEAANLIFYNGGNGISVASGPGKALRNRIQGNTIRDFVGLPIDLNEDGVTANDAAPDADDGPNDLQNFPIVTNVFRASRHVYGRLIAAPNQTYEVEIAYASGTNRAIAFPLVFTNVFVPANGTAVWSHVSSAAISTSAFVSVSATDTNGNTSEYSAPVPVLPAPDTDGDHIADLWELAHFPSLAACNPATDPDGDGYNNLDEYVMNTQPTNKAACFRFLGIDNVAGTEFIRMTYYQGNARLLNLQRCTNLASGHWITVSSFNSRWEGTGTNFTAAASNTAYRFQLSLP